MHLVYKSIVCHFLIISIMIAGLIVCLVTFDQEPCLFDYKQGKSRGLQRRYIFPERICNCSHGCQVLHQPEVSSGAPSSVQGSQGQPPLLKASLLRQCDLSFCPIDTALCSPLLLWFQFIEICFALFGSFGDGVKSFPQFWGVHQCKKMDFMEEVLDLQCKKTSKYPTHGTVGGQSEWRHGMRKKAWNGNFKFQDQKTGIMINRDGSGESLIFVRVQEGGSVLQYTLLYSMHNR